MKVAIIPARGGSKRIPRKNVRMFRGKPMLVWSIEAAQAAQIFDEVMVSTDDAEIAAVAEGAGAAVPFPRSAATSDDFSTTADVLLEVLGAYRRRGAHIQEACCIYATAPFVRADDLRRGWDEMQAHGLDAVFPVARFDYPIWRSLRRGQDGRVSMNFPEYHKARSQDVEPAFHDAGQWYWFSAEALARQGSLMGPNTGSLLLPSQYVQDIDTEEDWRLAEWKHERLFG